MKAFSAIFIFYFATLLTVLVSVKIMIIAARITTGQWPASGQYLINIVEWDKETEKLAVLTIAALVLALMRIRK